MAAETHIQGIARFIIGFGTEEDDIWRDYHFDFCGHIDYDASGSPTVVQPVENSGYSLGILQLDFGQTKAAAQPFVASFDTWRKGNPNSKPLTSSQDFVVAALTKDGHALKADASLALRLQDVEALSAYVLTPDGSDWVNGHIDDILIGSDSQGKSPYDGEWSLVGIARQMEATDAFKNADKAKDAAKIDVLYAMTMKAYNQAPGICTRDLLPFLNSDPSDDDIVAWPKNYSDAFQSGVGGAIELAKMWTGLSTPAKGWKPPAWFKSAQDAFDTQGLANHRRASPASGPYLAARLAFERSDWFPTFGRALEAGQDYIPKGIWDATSGGLALNPKTGRVRQGVMAKNKTGYFWDTAGDAFKLSGGAWAAINIGDVNSKRSLIDRLRSYYRELVPMS